MLFKISKMPGKWREIRIWEHHHNAGMISKPILPMTMGSVQAANLQCKGDEIFARYLN